MATSFVGIWAEAVKHLDAARDPKGCTDLSLYAVALNLRTKLQDLPPQPKATWKKLVQQLQVCISATPTQ